MSPCTAPSQTFGDESDDEACVAACLAVERQLAGRSGRTVPEQQVRPCQPAALGEAVPPEWADAALSHACGEYIVFAALNAEAKAAALTLPPELFETLMRAAPLLPAFWPDPSQPVVQAVELYKRRGGRRKQGR